MKTIHWLIGGFALLGLSGMLETLGDGGATPADRLPYYLPALIALMGAPFCFYRGIRSGVAEMMAKTPDTPQDGLAAPAARPAKRLALRDSEAPQSEFDADAALARYMAKRAAEGPPAEIAGETAGPAPAPSPAAFPRPQPGAARPAFGRRVV